jgi:hypothetical protein
MFSRRLLAWGVAVLVTFGASACSGGSSRRDLAVGDCVRLEFGADGRLLGAPEVPCADPTAQYKITVMSRDPAAPPCPALTATSVALQNPGDFLTILCLAKVY